MGGRVGGICAVFCISSLCITSLVVRILFIVYQFFVTLEDMELRSSFTAIKRNADDGQPHKTAPGGKKKKVEERTMSIWNYVNIADITKAVHHFLEIYEQDKMKGLLKVKMCIFRSAGCTRGYMYNREMDDDDENILSYFENWNERQYSLLSAGQKKLRENFCKFIESLIDKCEIADVLYDKFMMNSLLSFFDVVAVSEVTSIRYTATLSALMTMRALIKIIVSKKEEIRKLTSQLNAEMQKPEVHQEVHRIQDLQLNIQNLSNNLEDVQLSVGHLRKYVFETRIHDCETKIRSICFLEIGEWLNIHPEMVLQDEYMDYLMIPLCNKAEVATVHKLCSSILCSVFEESSDMVQIFAKDIKNILLRMAMSGESKLSSAGFYLLTKVSKLDVLEDGESTQLYQFVYLDHPYRKTAQTAGKFLIGQLEKMVKEDLIFGEVETATTAKMHLLYHLVHFHIRYGRPGNSAFLVDSVYEWTPIVRDWKSMEAFYLRNDRSDEEEFAFLEILSSCVRHGAMGQMPEELLLHFPRTQTDKKIGNLRMKFSESFGGHLPVLIKVFRDDPAQIYNILLAAQCVFLDYYVMLRKASDLIALLEEIKFVMETSSDWKVLKECAHTFKELCVEEHSTYALCAPICDLLTDGIKNKCIETCQAISEVEFCAEPQKTHVLLSELKRVAAFSGYFNMFNAKLYKFMIQYANSALLSDDENILERAKYSFLSCVRFFMTAIRNISDKRKCNELQINALREMLNECINVGIVLLHVWDEKVRYEAFLGICQAIFVFSEEMAHTFSFQDFSSLVYIPPQFMNNLLLEYVRERIFTELPKDNWNTAKEETTMRRLCLNAFCSLIVKSIISEHGVPAEIFGQYLKFAHIFKDIFDGMIVRIQTQDKCNFVLIVHKCLVTEFLKAEAIGRLEEITEAIEDLKKLAEHFSNILGEKATGPEQQKALKLLHDEGIKFSVTSNEKTMSHAAPPNIRYLEILIIFVEWLTPQGCKHSYRYLRKFDPARQTSQWMPFIEYRSALKDGWIQTRRRRPRR